MVLEQFRQVPENQDPKKTKALDRADKILQKAGVVAPQTEPAVVIEKREMLLSDKFAQQVKSVIEQLDPNTPLASLILWNEDRIKAEKSRLRAYLGLFTDPALQQRRKEAVTNNLNFVEKLPDTPKIWSEFVANLPKNARVPLISYMRTRLLRPISAESNYSYKIAEVASLYEQNADRWKNPTDRFVLKVFENVRPPDNSLNQLTTNN